MCVAVKDEDGNYWLGTVINVNQPIQFITIWFDDGTTECDWDCTDPKLCFLKDSNGEVVYNTDMTLDVGVIAPGKEHLFDVYPITCNGCVILHYLLLCDS